MKIMDLDADTIFELATLKRSKKYKMKVFDWHKAVRIIKKHNVKNASAGLAEDWSYTSDFILKNNHPVLSTDTYTYLASIWATPVLLIEDADEAIECWCWEDHCDWNAETLWPKSALMLFMEGKDNESDSR